MKPYWFKLTEHDGPMPIKPKTYKVATLLGGVLIGVVGSYFLIPPQIADTPVQTTISKPIEAITPIVPAIKNPMLNPSNDEDDDSEDEDDD